MIDGDEMFGVSYWPLNILSWFCRLTAVCHDDCSRWGLARADFCGNGLWIVLDFYDGLPTNIFGIFSLIFTFARGSGRRWSPSVSTGSESWGGH